MNPYSKGVIYTRALSRNSPLPELEIEGPGFFDNVVSNAKDLAIGVPLGIAAIGATLAKDAAHIASLGHVGKGFGSDDVAKGMAKGFLETSVLPKLLPIPGVDSLNWDPINAKSGGSALERAKERPIDALLDTAGLVLGGYGAAAKGAKLAATHGLVSGDAAAKAMRFAGYKPIAPGQGSLIDMLDKGMGVRASPSMADDIRTARGIGNVNSPLQIIDDSGDIAFSNVHRDRLSLPDGTQWARQTHRAIGKGKTPDRGMSTEEAAQRAAELDDGLKLSDGERYGFSPDGKPIGFKRRSRNELSAKIGDIMEGLYSKYVPDNLGVFGNTSRIGRMQQRALRRTVDTDLAPLKEASNEILEKVYGGRKALESMSPEERNALDIASFVTLEGFKDAHAFGDEVTKIANGDVAAKVTQRLSKLLNDQERLAEDLYADVDNVLANHADELTAEELNALRYQSARGMARKKGDFTLRDVNGNVVEDLSHLDGLHDLAQRSGIIEGEASKARAYNATVNGMQSQVSRFKYELDELAKQALELPESHPHARLTADSIKTYAEHPLIKGTDSVKKLVEREGKHSKDYAFFKDEQLERLARYIKEASPDADGIIGRIGMIRRNADAANRLLIENQGTFDDLRRIMRNLGDRDEAIAKDNFTTMLSDKKAAMNRRRLEMFVNAMDDLDPLYQSETRIPGADPVFRSLRPHLDPSKVDKAPSFGRNIVEKADKLHSGERSIRHLIRGNDRIDPFVYLEGMADNAKTFRARQLVDEFSSVVTHIDENDLKRDIELGIIGTADSRSTPYVIADPSDPILSQFARNIEAVEDIHESLRKNLGTQHVDDFAADLPHLDAKAMIDAIRRDGPRKDVVRSGGRVAVIPRRHYNAIAQMVQQDTNFLARMTDKTSNWFKIGVLHMRFPSWVMSNAIGSYVFGLMASDDPRTAYRVLTNHKVVNRIRKRAGIDKKNLASLDKHINTYLGDAVSASGSKAMFSLADETITGARNASRSKVGMAAEKLLDSVGRLNDEIADNPMKMQRVREMVLSDLDVIKKDLLNSEEGLGLIRYLGDNADDMLARQMLSSDGYRAKIADDLFGDMIDFRDMSVSERKYLYRAMPFYSWFKGSSKVAAKTLHENPVKAAIGKEIANEGNRQQDEQMPIMLPDFMRVAIPIGDQDGPGLTVVGSNSWNPYATPLEMLGSAASMIPGGAKGDMPMNPLSMTHPVPKALLETILRRDSFNGQPLPVKDAGAGAVFLSRVTDIPAWDWLPTGNPFQYALDSSYRENPYSAWSKSITPGMTTYPSTKNRAISYFLGVPIKEINLSGAHARGVEEWRQRNGMEAR